MSKFNIPKFLRILTYVNEVFKFLFPFLHKIDDDKSKDSKDSKDSSNVDPKNN